MGGLLGLVKDRYSIDGYDDDGGRNRQVPVASILIYLFFPDNDLCLLPNKFAMSIFLRVDQSPHIFSITAKRTLVGSPCMLQSL